MLKKFFLRNDPKTVKNAITLTLEEFLDEYKETTATKEALEKAYNEIRLKSQQPFISVPEEKKDYVQGKSVTFKVIKDDTQVKSTEIKPVTTGMIDTRVKEKAKNFEQDLAKVLKTGIVLPNFQKVVDNTPKEIVSEVKETLDELDEENELTEEELNELALLEAQNTVDNNKLHGTPKTEIQPLPATVTPPATQSTKKGKGRPYSPNATQRDARIIELLKAGTKGSKIIEILAGEGFITYPAWITGIKKKMESEKAA